MDLIRTIVLHVREPNEVNGYHRQVLAYHYWLIFSAGLADGVDASPDKDLGAQLYTLTWSGQNFADAPANESLWKEATKAITRTTTAVGAGKADVQAGLMIYRTNRLLSFVARVRHEHADGALRNIRGWV